MGNLNYLRYRVLKPFKSWKNKYLKGLTRKQAKSEDLYTKAAREVSEYTGEPIANVKEKHKTQGPQVEPGFAIFNHQKDLNKLSVGEFYKRCSYYLYELPLWNAEINRPKYLCLVCLPYLKRNAYRKVLDFGAGTGDFCIELANAGLEVTYCDIAERLFAFAEWRFVKHGLPIVMVKGIDKVSQEYDCIFSFDAFEHIKDLFLTLEEIVSHIRIGGSLVFSGAFSGGTLHLEENEKYDHFKNLDCLMRSCGLIFQDRFAQYFFYKKGVRKISLDKPLFSC